MKCWSCNKEIDIKAEFCPHCEANVMEEPSAEELAAAANAISAMSPDMLQELYAAFDKSSTGEEFVNRIMIGDCPKCSSSKTGDCENDSEIEDPCVARCFDCGQLWCADCAEFFKDAAHAAKHDCPVWEEMGWNDELDEGD